ncbi:MAG: hypothetical protein D6766_11890, partial [Verrucomicrobia bacterium]
MRVLAWTVLAGWALAAGLGEVLAQPAEVRDYLSRWYGRQIREFDIRFVLEEPLSEEEQKASLEETKRAFAAMGLEGWPAGPPSTGAQYFRMVVRPDRFVIERGRKGDGAALQGMFPPNRLGGWCSNGVWSVSPWPRPDGSIEVRLDHDVGKRFSDVWEAWLDPSPEKGAALVVSMGPVRAMAVGIDLGAGELFLDGASFRVVREQPTRLEVVGRFLVEDGRLAGLEYENTPQAARGSSRDRWTARYTYREGGGWFPREIRLENQRQTPDGGTRVDRWVYRDIEVALGPKLLGPVVMSPFEFIEEHSDVARLLVISNRFLYLAYGKGGWNPNPVMTRLPPRGVERWLWQGVRILFVSLLVLPVVYLAGRKVLRRSGARDAGGTDGLGP